MCGVRGVELLVASREEGIEKNMQSACSLGVHKGFKV